MSANERSFSDVFQDIVRNVQEIVRSEVRLAKTEIRDEAAKAKSAGLLIGAGAVTAIFAAFFLLLTIVYLLSLIMPNWAAALIVGVALAIVAGVTLNTGLKRFKKIHPTPERTVETLKENVEWVKQQTK
ncbi:MAG: phage holin family protein [Bryobacterales bacterium]|nr:phage holin family protein [Bryobacterales bacterium]MBV9397742.1 phage holin family protein [Bryobacterales bacterium]